MKNNVLIFDTTLRDGTQAEKISFSVEDKIHVAKSLDEFGVDYIEGGWPGSNPKDMKFFNLAKDIKFKNSKLVAFGSTKRVNNKVEEDGNIKALLDAGTPAISIFGKSWILHVKKALKITPEENLELIYESISYLKNHNKEIIYDAEHFFDGYKDNSEYALETLRTAEKAGADVIALCDTNGGTIPSDIIEIVKSVKKVMNIPLGIHAHNDSGLAVANSIAAVQSGCVHVQGTINGYGERCGNANLCEIIPNLQLKLGYLCVMGKNLNKLTTLSRYISEIANLIHNDEMPFAGRSAFAHKGGIHVSAVMKEQSTYEHIKPETVGNARRVLISDLSGQSNIKYKAKELSIDLTKHGDQLKDIVQKLKTMEHQGYQYEAAEGSFELLINRVNNKSQEFFKLQGFRVMIEKNESGETRSEATVRVSLNNKIEHSAAEGNGPINALDNALRKALISFYPNIKNMKLSDFKVRVLNADDATKAKVRVLIDSNSNGISWGTVGVSENIIEASWEALTDSVSYFLLKQQKNNQ